MTSQSFSRKKVYTVPGNLTQFQKIDEIPFRESWGFLINCSIQCVHVHAEDIEFAIDTVKSIITDNQFTIGPTSLNCGNLSVNLKKEIPIILGNSIMFFVKNSHYESIEIEIATELRYEQYRRK